MPRHTTDHYASDKKPPATLTTIIKRTPRRARESPTRPMVVAPDLLVEVGPFGVEVGALGTNVPVAEARHELATAAADAVEALLFTVPLPPKLHCWALRLFAS